MPVYLFTFHAYGSWMPDRPRGYVKSKQILKPNSAQANRYREAMAYPPIIFKEHHQRSVIDVIQEACQAIQTKPVTIATDATHIHALIQWRDERDWQPIRTSIKRAITIRLKRDFESRPRLSRNASRKRITEQSHYNYLFTRYLPSHRGVFWSTT